MKIISITSAVLLAICPPVHAAKCQAPDGNWYPYDSPQCGSGRSPGTAATPDRKVRTGEELVVSTEVVQQCFDGYRKLSLDPTDAKLLGYSASIVPAGFPVLHVSAVFKNKYGGPDNQLLWCKLTEDLQLDQGAMKDAWFDFFKRLHS